MPETYFRLCAWCKREIGRDNEAVGEPYLVGADEFAEIAGAPITHGICGACAEAEARSHKLTAFLGLTNPWPSA